MDIITLPYDLFGVDMVRVAGADGIGKLYVSLDILNFQAVSAQSVTEDTDKTFLGDMFAHKLLECHANKTDAKLTLYGVTQFYLDNSQRLGKLYLEDLNTETPAGVKVKDTLGEGTYTELWENRYGGLDGEKAANDND